MCRGNTVPPAGHREAVGVTHTAFLEFNAVCSKREMTP